MGLHILDLEQNAEGSKLAYLSPADEDGKPQSGYRIAGPKAWGGSRNLARLKITSSDLVTYIKQYAPEVAEELASK
jgi:hypothetical protein